MMLRLGSVIEYGFGPNTAAISLIYSYLLSKYCVGISEHVFVNHIGNDLQEVIVRQKKEIAINIRWDLPDRFMSIADRKKNIFFIEIIHAALLRLAKEKETIVVDLLEEIKAEILRQDFLVDVIYRSYTNQKNKELSVEVVINPTLSWFNFYMICKKNRKETCKILIYQGKPSDYYIEDLFSIGKWKGQDQFILKGKRSEVEFHLDINDCKVRLVNTSPDKNKTPIFNMFRVDAGEKELEEYIRSLNPAIAVIITQSWN